MEYIIQDQNIFIDVSDDVFEPSPHGSKALGNLIEVQQGEKILDIGTGTGLLAILAAKFGGNVSATDILPQAVELTKHNALKNGVSLDVRQGDLFGPFSGEKFDVIIANVPQENLSPKVQDSLSREIVVGMHGGVNGNKVLLDVLKQAPNYMHAKSRLYVVVYSMSNFRVSLQEIIKNYDTKLINFYTGPVKDFVYSDLKWYEERSRSGEISIYKNGTEYWADLFVFELKLKQVKF